MKARTFKVQAETFYSTCMRLYSVGRRFFTVQDQKFSSNSLQTFSFLCRRILLDIYLSMNKIFFRQTNMIYDTYTYIYIYIYTNIYDTAFSSCFYQYITDDNFSVHILAVSINIYIYISPSAIYAFSVDVKFSLPR